MEEPIEVGVLGVQGDFGMHVKAMRELEGVSARVVRTPAEISCTDALIIPGGESTTLSILFERWGLREPVMEFIQSGRAVWGTCAGAILLSSRITENGAGVKTQPLLAVDVTADRNAYGRQAESFEARVRVSLDGGCEFSFPGVFIRAPKFTNLGNGARSLGELGDEPVMIEQVNVLITSFHPELTGDDRIHLYFIKKARGAKEELK